MMGPRVCNVKTKRERQLAHALRHAVEWIHEAVPGQDTRWYENVLRDEPDVICGLAADDKEDK